MVTTTSGPEVGTGTTVRRLPARSSRLFVCAECMYAQLFAVQPRALCTRRGAPFEGVVLFAGQPACPRFVPRKSVEPVLSVESFKRDADASGVRAGPERLNAE